MATIFPNHSSRYCKRDTDSSTEIAVCCIHDILGYAFIPLLILVLKFLYYLHNGRLLVNNFVRHCNFHGTKEELFVLNWMTSEICNISSDIIQNMKWSICPLSFITYWCFWFTKDHLIKKSNSFIKFF